MRAPGITLAVLLCAACGSKASSTSNDPVAAAAKQTSAKGGTYTVAIDFSKVSKTGGKYDGSGAFDGDGNFTLDVAYNGMPIHAIAAANAAKHLVVYMKSAAFLGQLPDDRTWAAAGLTRLVERSGRGRRRSTPYRLLAPT